MHNQGFKDLIEKFDHLGNGLNLKPYLQTRKAFRLLLRPSISVITPIHNGEKFIAELCDSILNQTCLPLEHVVVDDGSSDSTNDLLHDYHRKTSTYDVVVIEHANVGEAESINRAVTKARGDYLIVVNVDDPLEAQALEMLSKVLREDAESVVAYPDWKMIDVKGFVIQSVSTLEYSKSTLLDDLVCIPGPGAMIRKSAIERNYLRDASYRYISDYEQWVYLSSKGSFTRVPMILASWRSHGAGATNSSRGKPVALEYKKFQEETLMNLGLQGPPIDFDVKRFNASSFYMIAMQKLYDRSIPGRRMMLKSLVSTYSRHGSGKRRSVSIILGVLLYPSLNLFASLCRQLKLRVPQFILSLPPYQPRFRKK